MKHFAWFHFRSDPDTPDFNDDADTPDCNDDADKL